jgi:hypothetical protein
MVDTIVSSIADSNSNTPTRDFRDLGEKIYLSFSSLLASYRDPGLSQHLHDFSTLFHNLLRATHNRDLENSLLLKNLEALQFNSHHNESIAGVLKENMSEIM